MQFKVFSGQSSIPIENEIEFAGDNESVTMGEKGGVLTPVKREKNITVCARLRLPPNGSLCLK